MDPDLWVEIKRIPEPPPPVPPSLCASWYALEKIKNSSVEPELFESIFARPANPQTGDPATSIRLDERADIRAAWNSYLSNAWRPWAERHRKWKDHHSIYSALFTLEQQVKRLGEAYELLVGIGLLTWLTPTNERIRRHLVVAQASLRFDSSSGTISMRASGDGAKRSSG